MLGQVRSWLCFTLAAYISVVIGLHTTIDWMPHSVRIRMLDRVLSILHVQKLEINVGLRWCRKERCTWGETRDFILENA